MLHIRFILHHGFIKGCKMKYKKKKQVKQQPPITIIGDAVTREIMKIKAIKG